MRDPSHLPSFSISVLIYKSTNSGHTTTELVKQTKSVILSDSQRHSETLTQEEKESNLLCFMSEIPTQGNAYILLLSPFFTLPTYLIPF